MPAVNNLGSKSPDSKSKELHSVNGGLIVEFVGPPGSGKTTNCTAFKEVLTKSNLHVYLLEDIRNYFHKLNSYKKLLYSLNVVFNPACKFLPFVYTLTTSKIINLDSVYRYYKLCMFNLALRDFIKSKEVDVVLLDQWIIQGIWSATIFRTSLINQLPKNLYKFYFESDYVLYFNLDTKTASERINARDTGKSRFDMMSEGKRLEELNKYNNYLFDLYNHSTCINKLMYSTIESPINNAKDFLHRLETDSGKHQLN